MDAQISPSMQFRQNQKLCSYCGKLHTTQAFISHSSSDKSLAYGIQRCCCKANVAPYLFEMSPRKTGAPSQQIVEEVIRSDILVVILGPEVAKYSWTQTWIGFETGAFKAAREEISKKQTNLTFPGYNIPKLFLIEDITQDNDAAVPDLDAVLLLDFRDRDSWQDVVVLLELIDPSPNGQISESLFKISNKTRLTRFVTLEKFVCPYPKCGHPHRILIWAGQYAKRNAFGVPRPSRQIFSLKCSACRSPVNVRLLASQQGPPVWDTKSWRPRPNTLSRTHVSRLL